MTDEVVARPLTVEIERRGDTAVVRCQGRLATGASEIVYTKIRPLMPETRRIVLDLAGVTFIDSMGLGTLVRLYVSAKSAGCNLELVELGKRIQELLGRTRLLEVFTTVGESGLTMRF